MCSLSFQFQFLVKKILTLDDPHAHKPVEFLLQLIGVQAGERFAEDSFGCGAREDGGEGLTIDAQPEQTDSLQQRKGRFVATEHRFAITLSDAAKTNPLLQYGPLVVIQFLVRRGLQLFRRA
jgi:hypothetical protein